MRWCFILLALLSTTGTTIASELAPYWLPTGGPDGLNAYDVVDDVDGTVILATADGIWRRSDGDVRWNRSGLDGLWVFAVGRSADGSLFAVGYLQHQPSLYRSTDGGLTWIVSNDGLPPDARYAWDFEAGPDGAMLAAGDDGVYRFDAAIGAWDRYSPSFYSSSVATDGVNVYASAVSHVYRSTDNGATWESTLVARDIEINALAAGDDGVVVAVAQLEDYWLADDGVVFVSTDFGASFRLMDGEPGSPGAIGLSFGYATEVLHNGTILVGGFRFLSFGSGAGVKASTDLGETWTPTGNGRLDVWRLEQLADGRVWAAGYHNVMVADGENWTRAVEGLGGADVLSFAATPTGIIAGGFLTGVSVLEPIGSLWRWLGPDIESAHGVAAMPNGDVVAAIRDIGAVRWSPTLGWVSLGLGANDSVHDVVVDGDGTICVTGFYFSCSADGGESWVTTSFDYAHDTAITSMEDGAFAMALWQPFTNTGRIVRSLDGGQNWEASLQISVPVRDLVWDGRGRVWAIREDGAVFVSHDLGLTWDHAGYLGLGSATSLAVDHIGRLFAGTGAGYLRTSSDGGASWRAFDVGLPLGAINDLVVSGGMLYAAVENHGVWATLVSPLVRSGGTAGRRVRP